MSKPKKLKILGLIVPIKYKDLSGEDYVGTYDRINKNIELHSKMKLNEFMPALLHEFGHALFDRSGLRQGVESDLEEVIVENFANALCENFNIRPKSK